jgi:hypothetical protein
MAKKIPVFTGRVVGINIRVDRPELLGKYVKTFKAEDTLEITIKKKVEKKSYPQLKYYMGVLVPHAHIAFLAKGETVEDKDGNDVPIDSYDADRKLKRLFLIKNRGTEFEYVPSKADISIEEMCYLIEQTLHYLAMNYDTYVETPEEWNGSYRILNEGDTDENLPRTQEKSTSNKDEVR